MPKLRYKDHPESEDKKYKRKKKKHKKRDRSSSPTRHHRHRRGRQSKDQYYDPPKLYEEESGWVPPQHDEEAEWRERLFSAMAEDEGQDPFYSQYDDYGGSSSGGVRSRSNIDVMNDEEYREYIASQMYRKKNAEAIAWEEAKAAEAKRKEKERKEAQERAREEEAGMQKERERQETILRQLKIHDSRSKYEELWKHVEATTTTVITKNEIPWPIAPGASFSQQNVKEFLVLATASLTDNKKVVRKEQLRYHPDKFIHRVLRKFEGTEKEKKRLTTKTNEVSGWLNELWQELNNDNNSSS
ncbi:hypothetical protein INT45_012294 [Circinella minor]|uniref:Uncharacterized protein n=1 Tax=Circinella minor TaxID=1195481 RepID=A0A8H7VJM9_9FUNG|nr:hypothetical protein INT45_012294 [Circinella minor]